MTPAEPLGGDAGRLLDNMLRAMQLHRHPRVFLAALERSAPGTEASADIPASLADAVAQLQPAMVLVLGHVAARAALGRTEPLGRLRAGPHVLAGCPAVVTYDPAFLLRSKTTRPPPGPTCAVRWPWCAVPRAESLLAGSEPLPYPRRTGETVARCHNPPLA